MPSNHLLKLAAKLLSDSLEREKFIQSLESPSALPSAIIWLKDRPSDFVFKKLPNLPEWIPEFVDLTFDKLGASLLHDQGFFYILDPSSVFAVSVLVDLDLKEPRVLDVCSAPGGKGIFATRSLRPAKIVFNEVIRKRHRALAFNLARCGMHGEISAIDPKSLATKYKDGFDLVLVDAPCSGQSLLVKGEKALGCFHPSTINLNSNRQKQIIANSGKCVAPGGYLLYSTCTFSPEENEKVVLWFLKRFPEFSLLEQPKLSRYQTTLSEISCYRLYPLEGLGAGAFTSLLARRG